MKLPARKTFSIKTFGNSMYPLLHDGDIVTLKNIHFEKIKINDIITVKKGRKLITHRVIYTTPHNLITKGDNSEKSDGRITPRHIVGKVISIKRSGVSINPEDLYLLQSTLYFQEIRKIKRALEKEKIQYLFLKGLPLHLYFNKSHPRRLYADCDILIDPKDFIKAVEIFSTYGYNKMDKALSTTHKNLQDQEIQISLYKRIHNYVIEFDIHSEAIFTVNQLGNLHSLYSRTLIQQINRAFLDEKIFVRILGEKYPILSYENLIIFLSHHLGRHSFKGIHRLDFLHTIFTTYINHQTQEKNLKNLSLKINKYKMNSAVYASALLLKKYYHTPFTKEFISGLKPNLFSKIQIEKQVERIDIFSDERRVEAGINRFMTMFLLSPYPIRKFFVFFHPKVIYSIAWVSYHKLRLQLKRMHHTFIS